MAGDYAAADVNGKTIYKKVGDESFQIVNTNCGWNIERVTPIMEEHRFALTYAGQCSECKGACLTKEALNTEVTYDGFGTKQESLSIRREKDHVFVDCKEGVCDCKASSRFGKCSDMAGDYAAADVNGKTIYKKVGDESFQIVNTNCGWNIERVTPIMEEHRFALTYAGQCSECKGACLTKEALNTTVTYDGFGTKQESLSIRRENMCETGGNRRLSSNGFVLV